MGCANAMPRNRGQTVKISPPQDIKRSQVKQVQPQPPPPSKVSESNMKQSAKKIHTSKIIEEVGVRSEVRKTTGSVITQDRSRAKVVYGANDTIGRPLQKPQTLVAAKVFTIDDQIILNRQSDYCQDVKNTGKPPSLLAKTQFLNYEIDTEEGVSKTPSVPTFGYQTILKHNIGLAWNNPTTSILRSK